MGLLYLRFDVENLRLDNKQNIDIHFESTPNIDYYTDYTRFQSFVKNFGFQTDSNYTKQTNDVLRSRDKQVSYNSIIWHQIVINYLKLSSNTLILLKCTWKYSPKTKVFISQTYHLVPILWLFKSMLNLVHWPKSTSYKCRLNLVQWMVELSFYVTLN